MSEGGATGGGDEVFEAKKGSMQAHAVNGAIVTGLSQLVKFPFQIASILILPRLFDPTDFGIYAMVMPLLSIVILVLNFGVGQAVVQRPHLTRPQVSALYRVMLGTGLGWALLLMICSPLIADLYNEPRAGPLAAACAFIVLYEAATNVPQSLMYRQMKFGWLAAINAIAIAIGLLVGVGAAMMGAHYWALLLDYAATCVITFIGVWIGVGWAPRDAPDFRTVPSFYRFGAGLMFGEGAMLVARHADAILIGRHSGAAQLGLYDRGNRLAMIPMERINQVLERILLPILSRMIESPERYRLAYLRIIRQLMLFLIPGTVAVGMTATTLIPFVLGEKWAAAAPIFAWLALAALHQPVSMTMNFLFISQGRTSAYFGWNLFSAITSVISFFVGLQWGAVGVAAAFAISDIAVRLPFLWWCVTRRGPIRQWDLYRAAAPFAAAAIVTAGALYLLERIPFHNDLLQLLLSGLAAYAISLGVIALFPVGRETMTDTVRLAANESRRLFARRRASPEAA